MGDIIRSPLLQKYFTTGLFLMKWKVAHCTQDDATQDLRCCGHSPQTSTLQFAELSSNTVVSSFTAASCCFRPGLLPLQLALALQTTTKRGDNHFKFHIQTAESMEIKCCVLHNSEMFRLFFFSFEGLINIGINPQLLAQGPDHRFIHSYLNHVLKR